MRLASRTNPTGTLRMSDDLRSFQERLKGTIYKPVRVIGSGGTSTVLLCERDLPQAYDRPAPNARFAVKLLSHRTPTGADAAWKLLVNEAEKAGGLTSNATVKMHPPVKTPGGELILVMEYVEGESLGEHLRRVEVLGLKDTVTVFRRICKSVKEAHRAGLCHGDLKPGNVMLPHRVLSGAKVCDWGLARSFRRADDPLLALTPEYASPAIWRGEGASERSDLFALGAMLYEVLAGEKLFCSPGDAKDEEERCRAIREQVENPETLEFALDKRQWPKEISRLLRGCLQQSDDTKSTNIGDDESDPFQNVSEFEAHLNELERTRKAWSRLLRRGEDRATPISSFPLASARQATTRSLPRHSDPVPAPEATAGTETPRDSLSASESASDRGPGHLPRQSQIGTALIAAAVAGVFIVALIVMSPRSPPVPEHPGAVRASTVGSPGTHHGARPGPEPKPERSGEGASVAYRASGRAAPRPPLAVDGGAVDGRPDGGKSGSTSMHALRPVARPSSSGRGPSSTPPKRVPLEERASGPEVYEDSK